MGERKTADGSKPGYAHLIFITHGRSITKSEIAASSWPMISSEKKWQIEGRFSVFGNVPFGGNGFFSNLRKLSWP